MQRNIFRRIRSCTNLTLSTNQPPHLPSLVNRSDYRLRRERGQNVFGLLDLLLALLRDLPFLWGVRVVGRAEELRHALLCDLGFAGLKVGEISSSRIA